MGEASTHPGPDWTLPEHWNMDGYLDFLWQGIKDVDGPVAVIWADSEQLLERNRSLYDYIIQSFMDITDIMNDTPPVTLYINGSD
jgi:hypothetical protein